MTQIESMIKKANSALKKLKHTMGEWNIIDSSRSAYCKCTKCNLNASVNLCPEMPFTRDYDGAAFGLKCGSVTAQLRMPEIQSRLVYFTIYLHDKNPQIIFFKTEPTAFRIKATKIPATQNLSKKGSLDVGLEHLVTNVIGCMLLKDFKLFYPDANISQHEIDLQRDIWQITKKDIFEMHITTIWDGNNLRSLIT